MKTIEIFPKNSDLTKLTRVKFGIDPTFPKLHLGHLVPLRIVKKMQDEGKEITIVLGTFTAQMGDPSGKDETRPILSKEDVENNANHILTQVESILSPGFSVFRNGDLFNVMTVPNLLQIASKFTTTRLLSRKAFRDRIEHGSPIGLHELIVPILQGTDSVHLKSEIEIGGSDQLFNFQIARELQEMDNQKPEACLMTPIINGTDGRKMSKSLNNCIFLDEDSKDIFGKCMSVSDDTMDEWIELLTDLTDLPENLMERKKLMSFDILRQLRGEDEATKALKGFEETIQKRKIPNDIPNVNLDTVTNCVSVIRSCSKTQARRLISGGAVTIDGTKIDDQFELSSGDIIKVGKRSFAKVI
ncbi:MAG: tyrosyl-tRNA synthetase [uncultured marine phage]|uniref:tyrosine--tRNA ligase n=1 Tax=uncultured marine phage TaxID=707152 RepID=A0A8D9FQE1_9VIRU|nr:MAG: tyrosyl-tRNA synthetase [uncultured marine phage]